MRQRIKTGELNKRLNYYDLNISKRQLQRWAHSKRLPYFLQHVKQTKKGDYRWNWSRIEKDIIDFEIENIADYIQLTQGGEVGRIKKRISRFFYLYCYLVPNISQHDALKTLYYVLFYSKSTEYQEKMVQCWEEIAPKVKERLKHNKGNFLLSSTL